MTNFHAIPQDFDGSVLARRQVLLATTLIKTLSDSGHNEDARDLATKLLQSLLETFPSLGWSSEMLQNFLNALDTDMASDYPLQPDARLTILLRKVAISCHVEEIVLVIVHYNKVAFVFQL